MTRSEERGQELRDLMEAKTPSIEETPEAGVSTESDEEERPTDIKETREAVPMISPEADAMGLGSGTPFSTSQDVQQASDVLERSKYTKAPTGRLQGITSPTSVKRALEVDGLQRGEGSNKARGTKAQGDPKQGGANGFSAGGG